MEALIELLKSLLAEGRMHNHVYMTRPQIEELLDILQRQVSPPKLPYGRAHFNYIEWELPERQSFEFKITYPDKTMELIAGNDLILFVTAINDLLKEKGVAYLFTNDGKRVLHVNYEDGLILQLGDSCYYSDPVEEDSSLISRIKRMFKKSPDEQTKQGYPV